MVRLTTGQLQQEPLHENETVTRDLRLVTECLREEENCLYTSTTFFIWLRILKAIRALLWVLGAIGSIVAANSILSDIESYEILMASLALMGVLMPGLIKATHLDSTIEEYALMASRFKTLQGDFRRAANVWSNKPFAEFEDEARDVIAAMSEAHKAALTPPEWCFRLAQRKVKRGDYYKDEAPI